MATQCKNARGYDPEAQEKWRKELGIPARFPYTGNESIQQMLLNLPLPKVFLREERKTTDLVIRFDCSSKQLPSNLKQAYFGEGLTLSKVFDLVLPQRASKQRSRFGSELSRLGYDAYRETWIRLFEILYLNQLHPAANSAPWLTEFRNALRRKRGRRKQEDAGPFMKRFNFFLNQCEKLRASVTAIADRLGAANTMTNATGRQVKESLWREIVEIPGGVSILGGEAFLEIPYATQGEVRRVENLKSWTARQLAIALLAFESVLTYQTVEKRVSNQGKPTSHKPR
jgi:hypothetical protein